MYVFVCATVGSVKGLLCALLGCITGVIKFFVGYLSIVLYFEGYKYMESESGGDKLVESTWG